MSAIVTNLASRTIREPTAEQRRAIERLHGSTLALPFVGVSKSGAVSTHWAPRLAGSFDTDLVIGAIYGRSLLAHIRAEGQLFLLGSIVRDMIERGEAERDAGVISGMMTVLSDALIA
jgi:hypothetical protein